MTSSRCATSLARTCSALLGDEPVDGPLNIASGDPHTVGEMATVLHAAAGENGQAAPEPIVTGEYRRGDVRHVFASTDRARRLLGFDARIEFADGMRAFSRAELRG